MDREYISDVNDEGCVVDNKGRQRCVEVGGDGLWGRNDYYRER